MAGGPPNILITVLTLANAAVQAKDLRAYKEADELLHALIRHEPHAGPTRAANLRSVRAHVPAGRQDLQLFFDDWLTWHTLELEDFLRFLAQLERLANQIAPQNSLFEVCQSLYGRALSYMHSVDSLNAPASVATMHRVHARLVGVVRCALGLPADPSPARLDESRKTVVLTIPEFSPRDSHAPTQDIRRAAQHLRDRCGLEPHIVVIPLTTRRLCPYISRFYLEPVHHELNRVRTMALPDGTRCGFTQMHEPLLQPDDLAGLHDTILALEPRFVLGFYGGNFVLDTLVGQVPVANWFTNARLAPTLSDQVILPRALHEDEVRQVAGYRPAHQRRLANTGAFTLPETRASLTRADLGLDPHAPTIGIVSMSMFKDVGSVPAFIAALTTLLTDNPDMRVALFGPGMDAQQLTAAYPTTHHQFTLCGFQDDVRAAIRLCDVMLNPPRGGGASAAMYAMAEGVPLVTLDQGDVGIVAAPEQKAASLDDLTGEVARLLRDPAARRQAADVSRATWQGRSDMAGMWAHVAHWIDPSLAATSPAPKTAHAA